MRSLSERRKISFHSTLCKRGQARFDIVRKVQLSKKKLESTKIYDKCFMILSLKFEAVVS